jgi:hypothetical protein
MMTTRARISVAVSFIIASLTGGSFVFFYWIRDGATIATWLTSLFVVISASIHLGGYLLYVQHDQPQPLEEVVRWQAFELSTRYWPALRFGILVQAIFGILTALMLDMGESFNAFKIAFLAHWLGILLIIARRPTSPTKTDIVFIRWGTPILLFVTGLLAPYVWNLIGRSELSGWQRLWRHWSKH